jgi:hypothetical protein
MLYRDCRILQAAVDINRAGKRSFLVVCVRLNQLKIRPNGGQKKVLQFRADEYLFRPNDEFIAELRRLKGTDNRVKSLWPSFREVLGIMEKTSKNEMNNSQPKWFENLSGAKEGALRLYCFPYAGSSTQVFRSWQQSFSPEISLTLTHLPGRGARISEPSFKALRPLVHALAASLVADKQPPFAFLGHSMGALISFELARELRRRGQRGPLALFVSGRRAPQLPGPDPPTFNLHKINPPDIHLIFR